MECWDSSRLSAGTVPPVWDVDAQKLITSLRAFLRFLSFRGECHDDLALAIPAVAHWRLARLPRCLSAEEVDRLIAACDGTTPRRLRDRAILLILTRLGLRSDEFGFDKIERAECPEAAHLRYKIIASRNQKRSTAVVTNVDFDKWADYLSDGPLAMAFLDRLVEGAIILKVKGKSYRAEKAKSPDTHST
jgi:site-specific recombinase XerD